MRIKLGVVAALAIVLSASSAWAVVIFDQSGYEPGAGVFSDFYFSSPNDLPNQMAADFVLGDNNVITDVHWWGLYLYDDSPVTAPDDFTIRFYEKLGGGPALDPFIELNPTVSRAVVDNAYGYDIYSYSTDVSSITLNPGQTYFISIVNNSAELGDGHNWYWETGSQPEVVPVWYRTYDGDAWQTYANPYGMDMSFYLTGPSTMIPEPATLTLVGLGGLGLFLRRRKSR